jgi:streptogramin lyase
VAIAPDGTIYVADGHGGESNARIVKFAPDGRFVAAWGKKGSGPREFNEPHGIALDSAGRVFVADRVNARIQVFDPDGKYLMEWTQFGKPSGVFIDKDDTIYVADSQTTDDAARPIPAAAAVSASAARATARSNISSRAPTRVRTRPAPKVSPLTPTAMS